jgi:prophage regulatory protein
MHPHQYRKRGAVPKTRPELVTEGSKSPANEAAAPRPPPASNDAAISWKLLKWPAVHERTGKSRSQAWRDIRAGRFPAPVQTGPNSVAWYEHEIDAYVGSLPRATYAPAAA